MSAGGKEPPYDVAVCVYWPLHQPHFTKHSSSSDLATALFSLWVSPHFLEHHPLTLPQPFHDLLSISVHDFSAWFNLLNALSSTELRENSPHPSLLPHSHPTNSQPLLTHNICCCCSSLATECLMWTSSGTESLSKFNSVIYSLQHFSIVIDSHAHALSCLVVMFHSFLKLPQPLLCPLTSPGRNFLTFSKESATRVDISTLCHKVWWKLNTSTEPMAGVILLLCVYWLLPACTSVWIHCPSELYHGILPSFPCYYSFHAKTITQESGSLL